MAGLPASVFMSPRGGISSVMAAASPSPSPSPSSSSSSVPLPPPPPPTDRRVLSPSGSEPRLAPPSVPVTRRDGPSSARPSHPLAVSHQFRLETSSVVGYQGLEAEDRETVTELLAYAITIKCPDKNYDSPAYERPHWARVECDNGEYVLVLGGWHSLEQRQLSLIWNFDAQAGDARNLVFMEVTLSRPNHHCDVLELALVMRWVGEKEKRRRTAQRISDDTAPYADAAYNSGGVPNPKKRGWVSSFTDFMLARDD